MLCFDYICLLIMAKQSGFNLKARNRRPLAFGDATNGFLWQMCYDEYIVSFEWCHAISDGKGAFSFFSSVLCHYFGVNRSVEPALELGLESLYNKKEKGIP